MDIIINYSSMKKAPNGNNPPTIHIAHVYKYQGGVLILAGIALKPRGFFIYSLLNPIKLPMKTKGTEIPNHIATIIKSTGNLTY